MYYLSDLYSLLWTVASFMGGGVQYPVLLLVCYLTSKRAYPPISMWPTDSINLSLLVHQVCKWYTLILEVPKGFTLIVSTEPRY